MVTWIDGALSDPRPASDAQVRAAQLALHVPLPSDFLAVARHHEGTRPVPAGVTLPNDFGTALQQLLQFVDAPFTSNLVAAGFPFLGVLPKGIIPSAQDVGGEPFCFKYREDYGALNVAFWSDDEGLRALAPSFMAFLDLLHGD